MAIIRLQSEIEKRRGICYQFDSNDAPIGEGGMGKVFKGICVDERNGSTRPVAIKFMYDDLPASAYERARREAEIQLRNDNLVEMLGFIETQEVLGTEVRKHYHVVSELLTGVSLYDVLEGKTKDRDGEDVPFAVKMLQDYQNDPEHFAQIVVINVLSGLMALHDAGYIHRDIDPSNIMLTSDGHIKLIDFGIAKQMNTLTTGDRSLTVAGKFMGKPEYAAPELALGDINHQNQTTDIYAVGILLYQCIIGHPPFEGARHEILDKQLKEKLPLGKIKNKALKRIIATACEKKQELRYQTSSQMRVALENLSGKKQAMSSQKKWAFVAAAVAVLVVLAGVALVVKHKQDETKRMAEEKALVEQHQMEMRSLVDAKVEEGDRVFRQGASKMDEDRFEQELMEAYAIYVEAGKIATDSAVAGYPMDEIEARMAKTVEALDSAKAFLAVQAVELEELSGVDASIDSMLTVVKDRADHIDKFKNQIK